MKIALRLIGGLLALGLVTAATIVAGIGGLIFMLALFGVVYYAFAG